MQTMEQLKQQNQTEKQDSLMSQTSTISQECQMTMLPSSAIAESQTKNKKNDLARQVAFMREKFKNAEIVKDIGSGLNFKRKGLQTILQRLLQGHKFTLIVAHRDRLCRFGFELINYLFEQNGGEIMVLDNTEASPQRELTEDLLAILHVFSCRMHGLRRYENEIKEDKNLSDETTETPVQTVVRSKQENIQCSSQQI